MKMCEHSIAERAEMKGIKSLFMIYLFNVLYRFCARSFFGTISVNIAVFMYLIISWFAVCFEHYNSIVNYIIACHMLVVFSQF